MKKLIVDQKVSSTRKFNRYFEKYIKKNGYDAPMTDVKRGHPLNFSTRKVPLKLTGDEF